MFIHSVEYNGKYVKGTIIKEEEYVFVCETIEKPKKAETLKALSDELNKVAMKLNALNKEYQIIFL